MKYASGASGAGFYVKIFWMRFFSISAILRKVAAAVEDGQTDHIRVCIKKRYSESEP